MIATSLLISLLCITSLGEQIFKINKLNLIWNKAKHKLGESKLKEFKDELLRHEPDEVTLKKLKSTKQDKDGLFEASVRRRMHNILKKYSLEFYYDDLHPRTDFDESEPNERKKDILNDAIDANKNIHSGLKASFRDKRLEKLWRKAENSAFTHEQLMLLYEELQHQQDRLDEHNEIMNSLDERFDRIAKLDKDLNSIEEDEDTNPSKKSFKIQSASKNQNKQEKKAKSQGHLRQQLMEDYKEIKRDTKRTHEKILQGPESFFESNEQIKQLWDVASKSNFSTDELDSIKDELKHFHRRVEKLKHFQVELEKKKMSVNEPNIVDDETKHIQRKVDELSRKVEKSHKSIASKLKNSHEEL